ncbi:hypothetical protein GCM10011573_05820 [Enterococcus wangshanyuanii]|uniref:Uncharacterized protein n=1 Tax=Enterococcus wangshanyuanii TaxID=2005703 RepID=A0ABQ1NKT7_9ENTE|nr:hypothetical protein GCM10011573_05820 [Enterococcus wangshanyuanii]
MNLLNVIRTSIAEKERWANKEKTLRADKKMIKKKRNVRQMKQNVLFYEKTKKTCFICEKKVKFSAIFHFIISEYDFICIFLKLLL